MPKELEIEEIPDFLKDFTIQDPATAASMVNQTSKEKVEFKDPEVGSLEDLKKSLELETAPKEEKEEKEDSSETGEVEDKSKDTKVKEEKEVKPDTTEEVEEVNYSFKPLIEAMGEFGILDLEEDVEVEDSAEALVENFEKTINSRVERGLNEYKDSIPELGKQFLDYLEQGGDPRAFIEAQTSDIDYNTLDLEDESNQKRVIKEWLKTQDYSNDEIKETLQDYEDSMLLEKQAKLAIKKLEKIESNKTAILLKEQEEQNKIAQKQVQEYISNVQTFIKGSTEIAGLAINQNEKNTFEDYLFKRGKDGLTQYQRDINADPQKTQVELAFLKFKKYDFSKVAKQAESSAAAKIRKNIIAKTETTVKGGSKETTTNSDISNFAKAFEKMRKY